MYPDYWDEYMERMTTVEDDERYAKETKARELASRFIWCETPDCQIKLKVAGLCPQCKIKPAAYRMAKCQ